MTAETAEIVLRTGSLRWSSPVLFNDPFDVPRSLELPFTANDVAGAVQRRIGEYLSGVAEPRAPWAIEIVKAVRWEPHEQQKLMLDIVRDSMAQLIIPAEIALEGFRAGWAEKVPRLRILCYSAVGDSPTTWAHYADNHRGAVLQFESSDERESSSLLATPVIYRSEGPEAPLLDRWVRTFLQEEDPDWSDFFHEYYYVKGEEWLYEQEYRVITSASWSSPRFLIQ